MNDNAGRLFVIGGKRRRGLETSILRLFDRIVPNSVKFDIKEYFRSVDYHKTNMFANGSELFSRVDIETNAHCNRSCKICPYSASPKPKKFMPIDLYETLLDQLSRMNFKGRLAPVFYNEPLLDSRLPKLMKMARERLPKTELTIYTNGSLLTDEMITKLFGSGLDGMVISQYQDNLPEDDVRAILMGLPYSTKRKIRYRVLTDDAQLSTRGGLVEVRNPMTKNFCYQASTDAVVDCEGNVILCCNDYNSEHTFGNIRDKHILKIWNEPKFKALRKALRRGHFSNPMCRACAGLE